MNFNYLLYAINCVMYFVTLENLYFLQNRKNPPILDNCDISYLY